MALAIALIGIAIATASLAWQAWTWSHSGVRIRVDTTESIVAGPDRPTVSAVAITARNLGRGAAHITGWGVPVLYVDEEVWFQFPSHLPESRSIETTLQPQHEATWYADKFDLLGVARGPCLVKGYVRLGMARRPARQAIPISEMRSRRAT